MQTPEKSTNISSAMGRWPVSAMPKAGADDGRFADRRINHAAGAKFLK